MSFFRTGKLRFLYLLALAQLLGGPLVLLQVSLFCKLTVREAPRVGFASATEHAWHSHDFQAVLVATEVKKVSGEKSSVPSGDPDPKLEKAKLPVLPWNAASFVTATHSSYRRISDQARVWTPAWPQAPPGPPPRMG